MDEIFTVDGSDTFQNYMEAINYIAGKKIGFNASTILMKERKLNRGSPPRNRKGELALNYKEFWGTAFSNCPSPSTEPTSRPAQ